MEQESRHGVLPPQEVAHQYIKQLNEIIDQCNLLSVDCHRNHLDAIKTLKTVAESMVRALLNSLRVDDTPMRITMDHFSESHLELYFISDHSPTKILELKKELNEALIEIWHSES